MCIPSIEFNIISSQSFSCFRGSISIEIEASSLTKKIVNPWNRLLNSVDYPFSSNTTSPYDHPANMSGAVSVASATKLKMKGLLSDFNQFEDVMKEGTRQRRETDEKKIQILKVEMGRIEKTLNSEVKRRVEMNKGLQSWCEKQIVSFHERLEARMTEKFEQLQVQIDALVVRIAELEAEFAVEKERIPREIEERGRILTAQLEAFQEAFEEERARRLVREEELRVQLTDHEHVVHERFEKERSEREQKIMVLKERLEKSTVSRNKADVRFQKVIKEEYTVLKNQIAEEAKVREQEDDEVVETLTAYTKKLQSSLHIINSMDS